MMESFSFLKADEHLASGAAFSFRLLTAIRTFNDLIHMLEGRVYISLFNFSLGGKKRVVF